MIAPRLYTNDQRLYTEEAKLLLTLGSTYSSETEAKEVAVSIRTPFLSPRHGRGWRGWRVASLAFVFALLGAAFFAATALGSTRALDGATKNKPFAGQTLHVQYWPTERQWIESLIVKPFERETGAKVVASFGATGDTIAKVAAQKSRPQLDVILLDDRGAVQLGQEGLLDPLSKYRLSNLKYVPQKFILGKRSAVGFAIYDNILLYNTKIFKTPPTSWNVLFDPQYAGKVALPPIEWGNGIMLLQSIARLTGTTLAKNPDKVFAKVEQLKPQVKLFLSDFAQVAQLFESKDLALTVLQPPVFKKYMDAGAPIAPDWKLPYWGVGALSMAAVKKHPASNQLVNAFMSKVLSKQVLAPLASKYLYGVTASNVHPPASAARWASFGNARLKKTFTIDFPAFVKDGPDWTQRWHSIFG
jgi:putative spermidine/putrescine transport system substrate-binding protein